MIQGFVGLPGQGKTLGMVYHACEALRDGRRVISNVPITDTVFGTGEKAELVSDVGDVITEVENALICIDEASIVLPNYYWKKLPFDVLMRFAQVRKYGLDIFYTSQSWSHTVKRLRDLSNYVVRCENHRWWFTYHWFDPEFYLMRVPKKWESDYIVRTKRISFRWFKSIYNAYDTMHLVDISMLGKSEKRDYPKND